MTRALLLEGRHRNICENASLEITVVRRGLEQKGYQKYTVEGVNSVVHQTKWMENSGVSRPFWRVAISASIGCNVFFKTIIQMQYIQSSTQRIFVKCVGSCTFADVACITYFCSSSKIMCVLPHKYAFGCLNYLIWYLSTEIFLVSIMLTLKVSILCKRGKY